MDICKYCRKWGILTNMTRLALLLKHIGFFIAALLNVVFKERLLLNIVVLLIFIGVKEYYPLNKELIYGALFAILITANLERSANRYKENILWDGDWEIWNWKNRNFEHKKGVYISLCTELTNIMTMISNDFRIVFRQGTIFTLQSFENIAINNWGYTLPIDISPDFNTLNETTAFARFVRFVNSFKNIENVIFSIQGLLTHINTYCPVFNVKSTVATLLQEMYNTKRFVVELQRFVNQSSPDDDALRWHMRLRYFSENIRINTGTLDNNINNLVACLYTVYEAINKDLDFNKVEGAH